VGTKITPMRLTDEDLANAKLAVDAGIAKDTTDAVRKGLAKMRTVAQLALAASDRPKAAPCRLCSRPTKNPCGVCDRHGVATATGLKAHRGSRHNRASCPLAKAKRYR
jgi:hypothetical protein